MSYRRVNVKDMQAIEYIDVNKKKIVIREGDYTVYDGKPVTRQDIVDHYLAYNREVDGNIRNSAIPLTKEEKKARKEWEEKHPGEELPAKWHISIDQFADGPDGEVERSSLMGELAAAAARSNPAVDIFYDVIDEMPEKLRVSFTLVLLQGYQTQEAAKLLGCSVATVSRRVKAAIAFIKSQEQRFNFR